MQPTASGCIRLRLSQAFSSSYLAISVVVLETRVVITPTSRLTKDVDFIVWLRETILPALTYSSS